MLFGPVARFASFYNVENGIDAILDKLKAKVEEGYSILVFPEGHRSKDHRVQRFHRGAFYMAEKLHLDILPIVVLGSGDFLPSGAFWGRPNALYMKILERVLPDNPQYGSTYSERTRKFRHFYTDLCREFKAECGTCAYYRRKLVLNYICKSPILEWYLRVKMKLASNYEQFNQLLPRQGTILDFGCGYGFISYMLSLTGEDRIITGIDHDQEKIEVAKTGFLKNVKTGFICADITTFPVGPRDAFLFSDVLHYLKKEDQEALLKNCINNLNPGGIILIRDADNKKKRKHKGTKLTEYFSTRILRFNKTGERQELYFTSLDQIKTIISDYPMDVEVIQESKHTSNMLFIIRHSP
jgi:2-polyprenyl-3-methyl-5-hydroxy-6-metoxy-1,4-benzoquinol methylase